MDKPAILVRLAYAASPLAELREDFDVVEATDAHSLIVALRAHGPHIRAVVTNGSLGLDGQALSQLPALELIQTRGVGFEGVDMETVRRRGIVVANAAGVNAETVADHAMALLLSAVRNIVGAGARLSGGDWSGARAPRPGVSGKRIGILGLGAIGANVAARAAGFGMQIAYHNRRRRQEVPHAYFETVAALAENSDFLVVTCPGGEETRGLVDAAVLSALGPQGFLVNVARGSVVVTDALVAALKTGGIAGAALDVFEGEPHVPQALLDAPNIIITPHMAARSPDVAVAAAALVRQNLRAHFFGGAVRNIVTDQHSPSEEP